jgi:uncharacterized membrane-anchored protein YhcB (DUF1043 family)
MSCKVKLSWLNRVKWGNLKYIIMKKLLLVVFVVILAMGSVFAQQGQRDPAARLQRELDGLTTELGLSKDQLAKVTPIVTETQKKMSDMYTKMREGGGDIDRVKMREERTKMTAEADKKIKAVVTAEQGVKLDGYRKKQAEERAKRMQEGH